MSSWARKAVLEDYSARFDAAEDTEALLEELGTPTRVAYVLAQSYVPSPPSGAEANAPLPEAPEEPPEPASLESMLEEVSEAEFFGTEEAETSEADADDAPPQAENAEAAAPEAAEAPAAEAIQPTPEPVAAPPQAERRSKVRVGGLIGFIVFCIVPGLPVAALFFVLGLPFVALGLFGALFLLQTARTGFAAYRLWSDSLLLAGGLALGLAVCLLLVWLGLWIGISLVRLWIRDVMIPWGKHMIFRKEEA